MEGNSTGVPFLEIGISHLGQVWVFVGVAMLVSTWLRAVWHSDYMTRVASVIPESGMLLVLGLVFGIIVHYGNLLSLDQFNGGDIFFDVLLPLILLPSTYYLDVNVFLSRLELVFIMLFAVLGTVISAVVTGLVIYYASPIFVVPIPILVALAYGALLAATDPVAVLATFDQLKVNDRLANIVEGEATLNDAAGITLFGFFLSLAKEHVSLSGAAIGLAVAQFFVITLGAAGFGIIGGILGSLLSRCSNRLGVLEPLMVMIHGLLVYTCANWLGLSGIIGLFVCNLIQSLFVDRNHREASRLGTKSLLVLLGHLAETLVFILVGVTTFLFIVGSGVSNQGAVWDGALIGITFAVILAIRFASIFLIYFGVHMFSRPSHRVPFSDMVVQSWSGLRGPVAFALVASFPSTFPSKNVLETTVIVVIWVTLFVIGITTKPLIKLLHVKLEEEGAGGGDYAFATRLGIRLRRALVRKLNDEEVRVAQLLIERKPLADHKICFEKVNLRRIYEVLHGEVALETEEVSSEQRAAGGGKEVPKKKSPADDLALFADLDRLPLVLGLNLEDVDFRNAKIGQQEPLNIFGFRK